MFNPEELVKQISAQVTERVKELIDRGDDPATDEKVRKIVQEMIEAQKKRDAETKHEFNTEEEEALAKVLNEKVILDDGVEITAKMLASERELKMFYPTSTAEKLIEWQKINDDLLIVGTMLAGARRSTIRRVLPETKIYQRAIYRLKHDPELAKALDTGTSGAGLEWIPTGFSNQLLEKIRLARKVEALFPHVNMPTNPYKFPIESAGATGYLIPESTADDATKIKASTPTTGNFQFSAKKFAGRVVYSEEISEDAIINLLDFVRDNLTKALTEAKETAIINGDDSASHQDSDVTSSYDARKAFKGLRYYALNCSNTATKDASGANASTVLLRGIRILMGKYGVDPTKLAYVVSPNGYIQMLNISEILTLEKYGPNATILKGEVGKIDGTPIIVSEYMWDNLNASGVYDGSTTNRTSICLVYTPGFWVGVRTGITLASDRDIETDQLKLVAKTRIAFEDPYDATTEPMATLLYNVKTTISAS